MIGLKKEHMDNLYKSFESIHMHDPTNNYKRISHAYSRWQGW